jgi:hypothetical protein
LFGVGDIGFEEFGKEIFLVGDKSRHFYLFNPFAGNGEKPLSGLVGCSIIYVLQM